MRIVLPLFIRLYPPGVPFPLLKYPPLPPAPTITVKLSPGVTVNVPYDNPPPPPPAPGPALNIPYAPPPPPPTATADTEVIPAGTTKL